MGPNVSDEQWDGDPHTRIERANLLDNKEHALKQSDFIKSEIRAGQVDDMTGAAHQRATYDLAVTIATAALYIGDSIREAAKRA